MLAAELVMQHKEVVFENFLVIDDGFLWEVVFVFGKNDGDDEENNREAECEEFHC